MKQLTLTALAIATAAIAHAQTPKPATAAFQYVNFGAGAGGKVMFEGFAGGAVIGKPFAATEERRSIQTLGDGTRIENNDTNKIYRDAQGRTRIERPDGTVIIADPAEGSTVELNLNDHTLHRMTFNAVFRKSAIDGDVRTMVRKATRAEAGAVDKGIAEAEASASIKAAPGGDNVLFERAVPMPGVPVVGVLSAGPVTTRIMTAPAPADAQQENLGTSFLNGVNAQGSRSTIVIPMNQIGNNRPIRIVNERWFSPDLQMAVKTSNSDPRFGESTYELKNIVQGAPDASLFEVPPGFTDRSPK